MRQPVRFSAEASTELEDAVRWYEDRHAGLGLAFLAAVENAVELLGRWPLAGEVVAGLPADLDETTGPCERRR